VQEQAGAEPRKPGRIRPDGCSIAAVPSISDAPAGWFQRAEQRLADRLAVRQLASVTARAQVSTRPSVRSRLSMWAVVAPVHAVLLGSLIGGGYLLVRGPTGPFRGLGVLLLLLAFATFPRPVKLPRHSLSLTAADAPLLFALIGDVAVACGTRPPRQVLVMRDFNAFATRTGWRRTPVLGLGAPLWVAAPPQARVALLGHELGHLAHGDLADSWWVWAGRRSLLHWLEIFRGPRVVYARNLFVMKYALLPFQAAVEAYLWMIQTLNGPASQRREYLADADAAHAAGTPGAVRMLEVLFLDAAVSTAMTRAAVSPQRPDMWELVRGDVAGFGDDDYRRRRHGATAERSRIDDEHPATVLRLQLLETLPPASARVVLDTGRSHALDAELARPLEVAAAHAGEHIRYRR
jgi:heat shock protein HtpX